ncbi:PD-(D/E)XK motif protein [Cryptosporangium minutisporangium]|uniref:PD-(D/E)XK motif protein n=1 Tax=Cryptosporangium minutisporangium TaxID=113569 RepID=A0ABP6SVY0_9ACTN
MNDDIASTVRIGWRLLATRRPEGTIATLDLPVSTQSGPAALGLDSRGDHHLLLPISEDHATVEDGKSAHVRVDTRPLIIDGHRRRYVDVVCHRPDLFDVFDEMIVALVEGVADAPAVVGEVVARVLQQWRELLRPSGGVLREGELRGLIGELLILQLLAEAGLVGLVDRLWTGPDRAVHDFTLGGRCVEVKTVGSRGSTVTIHGLDQLHVGPGHELVLAVVRLEAAADGVSLPELVEALERTIGDLAGLGRQLAKAGYVHAEADRYRARKFTQSALYAWKIDPVFPRLDVNSFAAVPTEVVAVRYDLDLAGLTPHATAGGAARLICTGDLS